MANSTPTTIASPEQTAPPPVPMDLRGKLEETVDRLLALLDAMDAPGEDLEPQGDEEPSLGSVQHHGAWSTGSTDDREEECEDEGAQCDDEGCTTTDDEPSLGWTNAGLRGNNDDDREHDPADLGEPEEAF